MKTTGMLAALILATVGGLLAAEKPATQPTTRPAAKITPEAQGLIDQVAQAYKDLKSMELAGVLSSDFDANGQAQKQTAKFTTVYQAPAKFRHSLDDDLLAVTSGDKFYVFQKSQNAFMASDMPKEKVPGEKLPSLMNRLNQMNPGLELALVTDPAVSLVEDCTGVDKMPDTVIDGKNYPTLGLMTENQRAALVAIDPQTHLIRQVRYDLKGLFEKRGAANVKSASLTIDYTTTKTGVDVDDKQFAFKPPEGAKDMAQAQPGVELEHGEGKVALEGKPAPDFTLNGLDDKPVSFSDLKGNVVVLDFWATWCPPCVASLPHLDKLATEMAASGVKVFAVNVQEDKQTVGGFIKSKNLTVPVLLDAEGKASQAYGVQGIPQTVVIGKDGNVRKVFVGFGPGSAEKLRNEIKAALEGTEGK